MLLCEPQSELVFTPELKSTSFMRYRLQHVLTLYYQADLKADAAGSLVLQGYQGLVDGEEHIRLATWESVSMMLQLVCDKSTGTKKYDKFGRDSEPIAPASLCVREGRSSAALAARTSAPGRVA